MCEMCGRYSLIADLGELARRFEFDGDWEAFDSAYNVAPTQEVLTVVGGETRRAGFMRWGLIPHWARDSKIGARMINARAETVAEKPASGTRSGAGGAWCRGRLLRVAADRG